MSTVVEAAQALLVALKSVPDMPVHTDMGAVVDPPALVVGPPGLLWQVHGRGPNLARFPVWVVVDADERALERLWDLVPAVVEALEAADVEITVDDQGALPDIWPGGKAGLPAYQIFTEVAL